MKHKSRIIFTDAEGTQHTVVLFRNDPTNGRPSYYDKDNMSVGAEGRPTLRLDIFHDDTSTIVHDMPALPTVVGSIISGQVDENDDVVLCLTQTPRGLQWKNVSNGHLTDIWNEHMINTLSKLTIQYDAGA